MERDERLSANFSLSELTYSETALRRGIDNTPSASQRANLVRLAGILESVRTVLGKPMSISSGYRSPLLNQAVGGAKDSAHLYGRAADFVCPDFGSPLAICREIVLAGIPFDQLIQEGRWVHLGIPVDGQAWRKEILTAHFSGGRVTYTRGLE